MDGEKRINQIFVVDRVDDGGQNGSRRESEDRRRAQGLDPCQVRQRTNKHDTFLASLSIPRGVVF